MIDPITLEVIREALSSIVREMRVNLLRTAYSSILYEGEDFSCVLMDAEAQLVAMSRGQDHPLHIVPIAWSMKAVREKFGAEIHPGDIFLHNDPYTGDTHLNDVAMIYPLFADGELFLFPVVRAHWGDVGGIWPRIVLRGRGQIPLSPQIGSVMLTQCPGNRLRTTSSPAQPRIESCSGICERREVTNLVVIVLYSALCGFSGPRLYLR